MSEIARELGRLGNEVIKNPKNQEAINNLAKLYAEEVYRRNLDTPGTDSSVVPFLEDFTKKIRQAGKESYGGSTLERAWEHALSKAMNDLATSSSDEVLNDVFKNYSQWARQNDMGESLPRIAGAPRIRDSWDFAGETLESMGLAAAAAAKLQAGKELTSEEENLLKASLNKWADHPYVKLRPNENNEPSLRTQGNQVLKWGKVFSIELMRELERTPGLQEFLPSSLKEEGAFKTLQTAMEKSLLGNFKTFFGGTTEDGVGGSNDHSAMAFAMLNSLNPKDQGDFMNRLNELLDSKGSKPGLFPYAPFRNLPINASYRDSAGRAVALALAQFQSNPNEENMQKALDGLEQFNDFSGSLRSHVTRSGVHAGTDRLAPYYWSPNLFSAGRLVSEMGRAVQQNPNSFSEESKSRLTRGIDFLEKSVLSTWNPDTQSFAHMGKETYQQLGPPAVTAPSLTTLRHIGLARSYLGNHGVPSPETPRPQQDKDEDVPSAPAVPPISNDPALVAFSNKLKDGLPQSNDGLAALQSDFNSLLSSKAPKTIKDLKDILQSVGLKEGTPEHGFFLSEALKDWKGSLGPNEISQLISLKDSKGDKPADALIRVQASLALQTQKQNPENKMALDWLAKVDPLLFQEDEGLLRAAKRREDWASGDAGKQQSIAKELAREMFSVSPEVRRELKAISEKQTGGQSESSLFAAVDHLYGNSTIQDNNLASFLNDEKNAAKQRAIEWNKKLKEAEPKWMAEQIKQVGGEDRFLKWAAQVGGETGDLALKQFLGFGSGEVQVKNKAQGFERGDTFQMTPDHPSALDLRKLISFGRKENQPISLQIGLGEKKSASGRVAYIGPGGEVSFSKGGPIPEREPLPPDDKVPAAPRGLDEKEEKPERALASLGPTPINGLSSPDSSPNSDQDQNQDQRRIPWFEEVIRKIRARGQNPFEELTKARLIRPELPPVQPPPAQEANRIQLTPARPTPQQPSPGRLAPKRRSPNQKLLWRALF